MPPQWHHALGGDIYVGFGLVSAQLNVLVRAEEGALYTSTVSNTFMTPGWRMVRIFFSAFLARGRRPLLAVISKEKILQLELSSYMVD